MLKDDRSRYLSPLRDYNYLGKNLTVIAQLRKKGNLLVEIWDSVGN